MSPVPLLLLKALVGGLGVVAFTAVARVVYPQRLAGLFCASPSIAVGSLAVVVLTSGQRDGLDAARGMVVGAVALIGACLLAALTARTSGGSAVAVSAAAAVGWVAVAALLAVVVW